MKNLGIIFMSIVALVSLILIAALSMTEDKTAPGIQIDQNKIDYKPDCDDSVLMAGVTAVDDVDGDVTDEVVITKRISLLGGQMEQVGYAVSDKSGNVTTFDVVYYMLDNGQYRILLYEQYSEYMREKIENGEITTEPKKESDTTSPEGEENSTLSEDEQTTSGEQSTTYDLSGEKPIIILKQNEISVTAGETINWVSYIDDIYDDKDDRSTLFTRVSLTNMDDMTVPGDYVQGLVCTDMDGNLSEVASIMVHVKAA